MYGIGRNQKRKITYVVYMIIFSLLIISYPTLYVHAKEYIQVPIIVDVPEMSPTSLDVTYVGPKELGHIFQASDFVVYPIYHIVNKDEKGSQVFDYTLSVSGIETEKQSVTITYLGASYNLMIEAPKITNKDKSDKAQTGGIIVKTVDITAKIGINDVATKQDYQLVKKGKNIVYALEKKESVISDVEYNMILDYRSFVEQEINVSTVYDISLERKIEQEKELVTEITGKATITLPIPQQYLKLNRDFYIMHFHNGNLEILLDEDSNPDTITITANKFSTFALCYNDKKEVTSSSVELFAKYNGKVESNATLDTELLDVYIVVTKKWDDESQSEFQKRVEYKIQPYTLVTGENKIEIETIYNDEIYHTTLSLYVSPTQKDNINTMNVCEHQWVTTKVESTCTEDGYTLSICQNCQEQLKTSIPATGHTYVNQKCTICGCEANSDLRINVKISWLLLVIVIFVTIILIIKIKRKHQ